MKFIIEHLSKHFDRKEVLKDISFSFESGKDLRPAGAKRRGQDHPVQLRQPGSEMRRRRAFGWKRTENAER